MGGLCYGVGMDRSGRSSFRLLEGGADRWGVDVRTRGSLADYKFPDLNRIMDLAFPETGSMGAWEKPQLAVTVRFPGSLGQPWEDSEEAARDQPCVLTENVGRQNNLESEDNSATRRPCGRM